MSSLSRRWIAAACCLGMPASAAPGAAAPTFNRDVAPIVFQHCVSCHHPGGAGPFALTNYREVKKHARQIVKVTDAHFMPPWLPRNPGFEGARGLTEEQIATLAAWEQAGAAEGKKEDLTAKAVWIEGWQLGKPDLVVTMPEPYSLAAEGPDVYRNFVIPSVVPDTRYVRAFELRASTPGAVHHAFVLLDSSGGARELDARDPGPGFTGMNAGPETAAPAGTFASWQPGSLPEERPADMAWVLRKKTDLVLQLHLRPTGKRENVRASVALYFTDQPPARLPFLLNLRTLAIDIPAGDANYAVERSYTLPIEGDVLAILPHMHFLGKSAQAWAELPDGTRRELLDIPRWDFNWQGAYRYAPPVALPPGTVIRTRLTFDNSKDNPRNPHQPPQRVQYGLQSSDEMGECWLQFLPRRAQELPTLQRDFMVKVRLPDKIAFCEWQLARAPKDAAARTELASAYLTEGRRDDAIREAKQALTDDPRTPRAHLVLGHVYAGNNQLPEARTEFEALVALQPENSDARNNLGYLLLAEGRKDEAIAQLEKALELNPDDTLARQNLERARNGK